ncbi:calcium ATPase [Decorospora gaudefroyi]|uniref:Calcium ATPase n=1 Tax=Decorospora gaudefroyi TaxID=184978 RepID=A0A6A5K4X8_9PLEO|nr:calcium ATPase [Decorospora gaudefroyi]
MDALIVSTLSTSTRCKNLSVRNQPTTPHNISSPFRNGVDPKATLTATKPPSPELSGDKDCLEPDVGTEADFEVNNNPFAFSPGQLGKLYNPKSLSAFHALGGLDGIEKGLRSDRKAGLSTDEQELDGVVTFEEATTPNRTESPQKSSNGFAHTDSAPAGSKENVFADRKRIFSDNRLPVRKPKNIFQLAWMAYNDKVLILLTCAAVISLALGLYQTFGVEHKPGEPAVEWIEGVAIIVAIVIVVVVGAANDWQKERQFVKLNRKKEDRTIKVIRSGTTREISVYDIFVGDVVNLEPGDMIPVDGILIQGHGIKCDESSATGESDLLKKTSGDEAFKAIERHDNLKKVDPFILSGAKVSEGVGSFMVTATGVHSSYGKTMMSLHEDSEVTPLQNKLNVLATYIAKLGGAAALILFVVLFIEFLVGLKGSSATAAEKGQNFLNILIVAITVIVVAAPEGLPLAVTLALAFAITRMLKDNNLVRLLRSCETMVNATTICSDKTGTLTQNKMTVVAGSLGTTLRFGDHKLKASPATPIDDGNKGKDVAESPVENPNDVSAPEFVATLNKNVKDVLLQSIIQNTTAFEGEAGGPDPFIGSKTETALLGFARDFLGMGNVAQERSNANIVQVIPFDSAIKCSGAVQKLNDGRFRMYVKGASEILLGMCDKIVTDANKELVETSMTGDNRETLEQVITTYASRSLRTIGLIYRDFESWPPAESSKNEDDPSQAVFKVVEGLGTFLVTATGQHLIYGKISQSRRHNSEQNSIRSFVQHCAYTWDVFVIDFADKTRSLAANLANYMIAKTRESSLVQIIQGYKIPASASDYGSIESPQRSISLTKRKSILPLNTPRLWVMIALFSNTVTAQSPNSDVQPMWKQRSLAMLEEILVSCVFLVAPAIVVSICLLIAMWFRYFKKEKAVFLGMLCIAAVFESIHASTNGNGTDDSGAVKLATAFGYAMFMLVYCELVMLRNNGGKLFCFVATAISVLTTLFLMAFAPVRTYWLDRTELDPFFALAAAIPLSFYLCDLSVYITQQLNGYDSCGMDANLDNPSERELPAGHRTSGLPYFDMSGLRSRNIFNASYDSDHFELELERLEAGLPVRPAFQPAIAGSLRARIGRLFR